MKSELYKYELVDRDRVLTTVEAETLNEALPSFKLANVKVTAEFLCMATIASNGMHFGVRWQKIQ